MQNIICSNTVLVLDSVTLRDCPYKTSLVRGKELSSADILRTREKEEVIT